MTLRGLSSCDTRVHCHPAGPGAAQQLVDTSKGYAVLLKKGSEPLTAGLMDVYGKVSLGQEHSLAGLGSA